MAPGNQWPSLLISFLWFLPLYKWNIQYVLSRAWWWWWWWLFWWGVCCSVFNQLLIWLDLNLPFSLLFSTCPICFLSPFSSFSATFRMNWVLHFIFYFGLSAKPLFKVVALVITMCVLITVYYLKSIMLYCNVITVQQNSAVSHCILHAAAVLEFTVTYVCSP